MFRECGRGAGLVGVELPRLVWVGGSLVDIERQNKSCEVLFRWNGCYSDETSTLRYVLGSREIDYWGPEGPGLYSLTWQEA